MNDEARDIMLMAYVDGELDAATAAEVERGLRANPALAARAEEFRRSSRLAREVFAGFIRQPLPQRVAACADEEVAEGKGAAENSLAHLAPPPRRWDWQGVRRPLQALAASLLLLLAGGAGYLLGRDAPQVSWQGAGGLLTASADLRAALEREASGAEVELPGEGRLRILASYPVEGDVCRAFDLTGGQGALRGLACRGGGAWPVTLAVSQPGAAGYEPAADGASGSLAAWLDGRGALPALSPEDERRALEQGWAD